MKLIQEKDNPLLKRKEIKFSLEEESNPGFEKTKTLIAEKMKASPETIAVKSIKNKFGTREFLINAFLYKTEQDKNSIEPKEKIKAKTGAN